MNVREAITPIFAFEKLSHWIIKHPLCSLSSVHLSVGRLMLFWSHGSFLKMLVSSFFLFIFLYSMAMLVSTLALHLWRAGRKILAFPTCPLYLLSHRPQRSYQKGTVEQSWSRRHGASLERGHINTAVRETLFNTSRPSLTWVRLSVSRSMYHISYTEVKSGLNPPLLFLLVSSLVSCSSKTVRALSPSLETRK